MATIAKVLLSDSTSGRGIKVVATATAGTDLHTAVSGGSDIDEIWLWASNIHTGAVILTLEWGGALDVAAFASVANVISVTGYVNRISA